MRYLTILTVFLATYLCASSAFAERGKADSIAVQARLTDGSDTPVPDGPKDLTISIWTDSVGGTMLHSEIVQVTTVKGTFSACIGCTSDSFFDIFTDLELFVQYQLSGQPPMAPRTRLRNTPFALTASSLHSNVASATQRAKGTVKGGGAGNNPTMSLLFEGDADDDGHADFAVRDSVTTGSAVRSISHDSDDDGLSDQDITSAITPTITRHAVNTKGTGAQSGRVVSVFSGTTVDSGVQVISIDSDGDGVSERKSWEKASDSDVISRIEIDDDDDGVPEQEISSAIVPTMSQFAVNTKGTGAQSGRVVSTSTATEIDSAVVDNSIDDDGDGNPESQHRLSNSDTGVIITIRKRGISQQSVHYNSVKTDSVTETGFVDSDGDGIPESEYSQTVLPTTCSVAINTKGTGADKNRVITTTTPDSVVTERTFEFTNSLLMPALMKAKEKANRTKCGNNIRYSDPNTTIETETSCDSAGARMTFMTSSAMGTGSSLTMQSDLAGVLNPIEHSSGAHLTSGGVWTNASDESLKENFQPVDGEQLLEKLEQLPISEWNYKSESDDVTHIGPTAQDFQKAFGVGENDKSISTIDPAGIALAAIKELNKKVKEVDHLKSEIQELKALMQKLAAENSAEKVSR